VQIGETPFWKKKKKAIVLVPLSIIEMDETDNELDIFFANLFQRPL
jgi:hypothetical protein